MSDVMWTALALMLVMEGLLPFLNPGIWRELFLRATQLGDKQIRFLGLSSMVLGLVLLLLFRS
ncbi:DUF2065 domain-containing protein [Ideonella azotifigens]|uniref:DUF2065 domain-containing protein n=1 Tax=Ideonella azotifigens TaxID=513160 RepID=A0ABN1K3G7_9BURK|nr:DUF2065 domain-containing protein [Ideonella azotifigens]MCD2343926.1 DUF2065 domain-containing protein [Ideonella azotifigens]